MAWYRFILLGLPLGLFGLLGLASSASAIIIESGGVQVSGHVLREDDNKLTIRHVTPEGQEKTTEFPRAKIKVVHRVEEKRLAGLSKDNPKGYRDYADELARQESDPEAKYMARRLYLIAASLDPAQYGVSSLRRLADLADSRAEARRCRALAYLMDPKADAKIIEPDAAARPVQPTKAQAAAFQDFIKAVQSYRSGKVMTARDTAKREGLEKIFSQAPDKMDQKSFLKMCTDANCPTCRTKGTVTCPTCMGKGTVRVIGKITERCSKCQGKKVVTCETCDGKGINLDLSADVVRRLLRAELWATEQLVGGGGGDTGGGGKKGAGDKSWSSVLKRRQVDPVLPLSLETITEFDPSKCHYRGGSWVVPRGE